MRVEGRCYDLCVPQPIQTNIDTAKGVITLVAGTSDTDRGLRIGYAGEAFPRIAIHPDGTIFTGNGTVEPATPFSGGGGGTITTVNGQTGPTVTLAAADVGAQPADADLTAIAALVTQTYGRSLLTAASAAAAQALLSLVPGTDVAPESHVTATTDVHGSTSGASKVAVIHTPAGTAENLYVDMESNPSVGQFAGDLRFIVPDGFFP